MIIALKGTIGSGKSTLAKEFIKKGYVVANCDEIVHKLYNEDIELIKKINTEFAIEQKRKVFSLKKAKPTVDRKKLGEIVFSDKEQLIKLESIVHPVLKQKMMEIISTNPKVIIDCQVVDKLNLEYDLAIILQTDEETIIKRIKKRDNKDEELIRKILSEQLKQKIILKNRTYVIDSTDGIEHILTEVGKIKELKND